MDALEIVLTKLAESLASYGVDVSGVAASPNVILALKIVGILIAGTVVKKGFKAYRKRFKWSSTPIYWASKNLKDSDNLFARLGFLPIAVAETVLAASGVTPLLGFAAPRSEEDRLREHNEKMDTERRVRLLGQANTNLHERLVEAEDKLCDLEAERGELLTLLRDYNSRQETKKLERKHVSRTLDRRSGHTLELEPLELPAAPPWQVGGSNRF